ncbi:MAG: hypothetical protein KAR19_18600 [Bacteroidales bacterium]|nr:hypothetical protein [Bacteroidales bacterium]
MPRISRREMLGAMGGSTLMMIGFSSCCFIREIIKHPCPPIRTWKTTAKRWWRNRKNDREAERKVAVATGKRADVKLPQPFLLCGREQGPQGPVMHQFREFQFNQWEHFFVRIQNNGNAPSWNCIVEAYETPWASYEIPYTDFIFNDRTFITLMPGEFKDVKLNFRVTKQTNGGLAIRSYDPIMDKGLIFFDQYDRHDTGFSWSQWIY